jgi:hypothetical protein
MVIEKRSAVLSRSILVFVRNQLKGPIWLEYLAIWRLVTWLPGAHQFMSYLRALGNIQVSRTHASPPSPVQYSEHFRVHASFVRTVRRQTFGVKMWVGFIWLRIENKNRPLGTRYWIFGFRARRGIFRSSSEGGRKSYPVALYCFSNV